MSITKRIVSIVLITAILVHYTPPRQEANAIIVDIYKIIKEGVKRAIKAVDLMVQRLQNETIFLQNVQKVLENGLNETRLAEIAGWMEKHRKLFADYYDELWKVKNALQTYLRLRNILTRQERIVADYRRAWDMISRDDHFTVQEIYYMSKVYTGILRTTAQNLDQVMLIVNSFKTQMTDAKRMEIINTTEKQVSQNATDLQRFNQQNYMLSLHRSKSAQEIETIKKLYGL
jgi:hypothetical protein